MIETCPKCDARLHAEAVLCVECGYHLDQGIYLSTDVDTNPVVEVLAREPNGFDDFVKPVLMRFAYWFAASFLFCSCATVAIFFVGFFSIENQKDPIPIAWVWIPILIVSLQFATVFGVIGVIAKVFMLLTSDSPIAVFTILSILAVSVAVYLFVLAWDWVWNWGITT